MKKTAFPRLLCLLLTVLVSIGAGAKTIVLSDFRDFDAIQAKVAESAKPTGFNINYGGNNTTCTGEFYIIVIPSDKWLVSISCEDEEDLKYFDIKQEGKTLVLSSKNKKLQGVRHSREECALKAKVIVSMPMLKLLDISGVHSVKVEGAFSGKDLSVDLSGVSTLEGLRGNWDSVKIDLSGVTKCTNMDIKTGSLRIDISGASEMGGSLEGGDVLLDCSGAGAIAFTSIVANKLEIDNSGAGKVKIGSAKVDSMEGDFSGAASVNIAGKFGTMELSCSGAGEIELTGQANDLGLESSGMADVKGKGLTVKNADINVSGCAGVSVTVTESLSYEVGMMSTLDYYGHPKTIKNSGRQNVTAH